MTCSEQLPKDHLLSPIRIGSLCGPCARVWYDRISVCPVAEQGFLLVDYIIRRTGLHYTDLVRVVRVAMLLFIYLIWVRNISYYHNGLISLGVMAHFLDWDPQILAKTGADLLL